MEQVTDSGAAHRPFVGRGVPVLDAHETVTVADVAVYARLIRDGEVFAIVPPDGAHSPIRLIVNSVAVFALVLCLGLASFAIGPLAFGYRPVVVASGSMEPSLAVADIVLVTEPHAENTDVGAVVDVNTGEGRVIHRIVEVLPDGFRTQGDANASADSEIVKADDISGVGVFLVPLVGRPRVWFDNAEWIKLGLLLATFVLAGYCSRSSWVRPSREPIASDRRATQRESTP